MKHLLNAVLVPRKQDKRWVPPEESEDSEEELVFPEITESKLF